MVARRGHIARHGITHAEGYAGGAAAGRAETTGGLSPSRPHEEAETLVFRVVSRTDEVGYFRMADDPLAKTYIRQRDSSSAQQPRAHL